MPWPRMKRHVCNCCIRMLRTETGIACLNQTSTYDEPRPAGMMEYQLVSSSPPNWSQGTENPDYA